MFGQGQGRGSPQRSRVTLKIRVFLRSRIPDLFYFAPEFAICGALCTEYHTKSPFFSKTVTATKKELCPFFGQYKYIRIVLCRDFFLGLLGLFLPVLVKVFCFLIIIPFFHFAPVL